MCVAKTKHKYKFIKKILQFENFVKKEKLQIEKTSLIKILIKLS